MTNPDTSASRNNICLAYTSGLDPPISQIGISLSSLFLRCVSHASFANDICGQPLPPAFVNPWNFFDGKLFQYKLSILDRPGSTLFDLCQENTDRTAEIIQIIDSLRAAILHNTPQAAAHRPRNSRDQSNSKNQFERN